MILAVLLLELSVQVWRHFHGIAVMHTTVAQRCLPRVVRPLLIDTLLHENVWFDIVSALFSIQHLFDRCSLWMHFPAKITFEVTAAIHEDPVDYHGIELRKYPSNFRSTTIHFLEHLPKTFGKWHDIPVHLQIRLQVFLELIQQPEIVDLWRSGNPVLVELLGDTVLAEPMFFFMFIEEYDFIAAIDL